jgi:imidazolonepropionase-like amidohydrolase
MIFARTVAAGFIAGSLFFVSNDAPSRAAARRADAPVAIVDVTVIPIVAAGTLPRQTVLIRDGRIVAMGPNASVRAPANARVIDGRGKFLVPGLVDAHVHLEEEADLPQFVAAGVTTVRDLMGSPETLAWRKQTEDGAMLGPRIIAAGPLFAGPQVPWRKKFTTEDPDSARAEVRRQHAAGYDLVKIYDGLTAPVYAAVMDEARTLGITATGHIPAAVH